MDLADLRRDFGKFGLDMTKMPDDPILLLEKWLEQARESGIQEFNAMVISTVDRAGQPSSRVVLLKQVDEAGNLIFYTNYLSRKGREIRLNPRVSVNFFWRELERQVRIEGSAIKTSREVSETYFRSRPLESQLSAIVSPQSEEIDELSGLKQAAEQLFLSNKKIKMPDFWGGYAIEPHAFEFWQGGKNRLHDRLAYTRKGAAWTRKRLAP